MDQRARLRGHGGDDLRVRVAKQVDGDAGDQVEVLATRVVVDQAALAADERDRQAATRLHQVALGEL